MTIDELKLAYLEKRAEIRSRLAEFKQVGQAASDEKVFEELTFCIFTAGASARMGLKSIEKIRPVLMKGSMRKMQKTLRHSHRFPNARGAYIFQTREYLLRHCGLRMRELLDSFSDKDELRDFFAANPGVRGLGYKEASHFLRNIGVGGYAILDKHVLSRLAEFGTVDDPRPPANKRRYLDLEARMKSFADRIEIDFDELDLLLWYTKTGEILK